jgi:hypothetical protein
MATRRATICARLDLASSGDGNRRAAAWGLHRSFMIRRQDG